MAQHEHFNWGENLQQARGTNPKIWKLYLEQFLRGARFDGPTHREDIAGIIEDEIKWGADMVGLFGSRARRDHEPLRSDVDLLVVSPIASYVGQQERMGLGEGVHIVRVSPSTYERYITNTQEGNSEADERMHDIVHGAVLIWKRDKENYSPPGPEVRRRLQDLDKERN
ncbi:MAG TPA: nucleotidyltransferase domain-containing protein [Patescibacteria group bacterium]|nr:nucleotidyltransferase domain-containing protein [Patescibacteria group bacterium]